MSDDANNTSRPRVRYEQTPNGEVVRVTEIFRQQLPGSLAGYTRPSWETQR